MCATAQGVVNIFTKADRFVSSDTLRFFLSRDLFERNSAS
jgi:hypothetical protein